MVEKTVFKRWNQGRDYTVEPGVEIIRRNQGKQSLHKVPELKIRISLFIEF